MSFSTDLDLADFLLSLQDPLLDFDQEPFKNDTKDDYNPLGISDDLIESLFDSGSTNEIILGLKDECKEEIFPQQPEVVDYAEEIIDCDTSSDGYSDDVMDPLYTEKIEEEGIVLQSDSLDFNNATFLSDDNHEYSFGYDYTSNQPVLIAYSTSNKLKIPTTEDRDILKKSVEDLNISDLKDELTSNDDQSSEYSYEGYPKLHLTEEEKKLAEKEGIVFPTRLPLTKMEERELKRIRRKIRNKISAQDSRKRKKEYVDGLEERVKLYSEENAHLLKRIKLLEKQNISLSAQVKKLQDTITKSSTTPTSQNSTTFLVLIMSLALVLAPSLRNSVSDTDSAEDEGISIPNDNSVTGQARTLLYAHKHSAEDTCDLEEETKVLSEKLDQIGFSKKDVVGKVMEMLRHNMKNYEDTPKDHDYLRSRKRPRPFDMDLLTNDGLPPLKIPPSRMMQAMKMFGMLANKSRKQERFKAARNKSVVIDLSSDEME